MHSRDNDGLQATSNYHRRHSRSPAYRQDDMETEEILSGSPFEEENENLRGISRDRKMADLRKLLKLKVSAYTCTNFTLNMVLKTHHMKTLIDLLWSFLVFRSDQ